MKPEPTIPLPVVAMLAHELRNPLAPIGAVVQLLKRANLDAEARAWAHQVLDRELLSMERIVNDLLDVSRIACHKLRLVREHVDLATVMERLAALLQIAVDPGDKQLQIEVPARRLRLFVDLTRIGQVLDNLIHNAAKFTPRGGRIWITATAAPDGREVAISVRDNGDGIERETLPQVFELFEQGATSRTHGGLGIGLSLVRQLVELHGGTVEALSDGRGKGSEFRIHLPVEEEQA